MLYIPVEEVAPGDYSPEYGHVVTVITGDEEIRLVFRNGSEITLKKETEIEMDQGGRFNHPTME